MDKNKIEAFLKDITEISRKYQLIISGCGCCGSPYILDKEEDHHSGEEMPKIIPTGQYKIDDNDSIHWEQ